MSEYVTLLEKMPVEYGHPITYFIPHTDKHVSIQNLLGEKIEISFTGRMFCINCDRKINKTFAEGLCFPCFSQAAANSPCIIRPELCEGHLGKGRDPEWEERNHNRPHIVYLAHTRTMKVGVTRGTNLPNRWIDQGAIRAIPIVKTPHRRAAGEVEVALKFFTTDKTPWQAMLKGEDDFNIDLMAERDRLSALIPAAIDFNIADDHFTLMEYPVLNYPTKINSLNLTKTPIISGVLTGIRGQYLMLDYQNVINIRSHSGFEVKWLLPE